MSSAADQSRALAACLRCRRQKLKCGGPGRVPCQRCRVSKAECIFVAPRAVQVRAPEPEPDNTTALLQQRLDLVEKQLRDLQNTVQQLIPQQIPPEDAVHSPAHSSHADSMAGEIAPATHLADKSMASIVGSPPSHASDIVLSGAVTEEEWSELHDFFYHSCRNVISFWDEGVFAPPDILRHQPLMATVVCTIAARAIKPDKYNVLLAKADQQILSTFQGPTPSLLDLWAMMLLAAWTGRARMWGYIASIAGELRLHEAALRFDDGVTEHTQEIVGRARAWFTLCCFDLQMNLAIPYVINRMGDYLPYAKGLLKSPFCKPADYRICTQCEGFTIAGDAKARIKSSQLQTRPLPQSAADLINSFDGQIDAWFHKINNTTDPLYQTFSEVQDRNRFMVPYAYMKLYINGLALHGITSGADLEQDEGRVLFIRKALDSAGLVIQTQFESETLLRGFRYTMDYNGTTTYHASTFILKALAIAHRHVDCRPLLIRVRQAAHMFEQAGATEIANDLRQGQDRLSVFTETSLSLDGDNGVSPEEMHENVLFDIPTFINSTTWNEEFPALNMYSLE